MNTSDKDVFLFIDGLGEIMHEYCQLLESNTERVSHAILFHGDTGCGKSMLSRQCLKTVEKKNDKVIILDLLEHFKASSYDSDKKASVIMELIEFELLSRGAFQDLEGKCKKPEMFKIVLERMLKSKQKILLIRLPKIEVFDEFEKYFSYLFNSNTILYFITEKKSIVDECKKKYGKELEYFECMKLKSGDGKLLIDNVYSSEEGPIFKTDDIESLMEKRPLDSKMTIMQLKSICEHAYIYAKKNKINIITKDIILDALISQCMI